VIRTVVLGTDELLRALHVSLLSTEPDIEVLFIVDLSISTGVLQVLHDGPAPDVIVADRASAPMMYMIVNAGRLSCWNAVPVVLASGEPSSDPPHDRRCGGSEYSEMFPIMCGSSTLASAVRAAAAGYRIIPLGSDGPQAHCQVDSTASPCSPREREVLKILARGATNQEIAEMLMISETTVRSHVQSLRGKLRARSRAELVARAFEHGLAHVASAWPAA
jgi:two-component system response regulator DesR